MPFLGRAHGAIVLLHRPANLAPSLRYRWYGLAVVCSSSTARLRRVKPAANWTRLLRRIVRTSC